MFLVTTLEPPAVLVALSPDTGMHAGQILKAVVEGLGGRGGGNAQLAQASLKDAAQTAEAARQILDRLG